MKERELETKTEKGEVKEGWGKEGRRKRNTSSDLRSSPKITSWATVSPLNGKGPQKYASEVLI